MAGKLVRNTSTEELKRWWDKVEAIAAQVSGLKVEAPRAKSANPQQERNIQESGTPERDSHRAGK